MYALSDGEQPSSYDESRRLPAHSIEPAASSVLNFRHADYVVASFNHVQSFALGVTRLVIGLMCIVFNVVNICYIDQVGWVVYVTGNGFWGGCMVSSIINR